MKNMIKTTCLATVIAASFSANAFESFEGYTGGDIVDTSTPIANMVSFDQCTDGEKSLQITFPQNNAWASVKAPLSASVDFTANTHFSFDAIRDSNSGAAPLLVKLIDSVGNEVWHWTSIDQDDAAVYTLDLSYNDGSDTDGDLSDIVMVDFVDAGGSGTDVQVYIDNLRLSDGTATVGAGCNQPTDPAPVDPVPTPEPRYFDGGSTGVFTLFTLLGLVAFRRKSQK